MEANIIFENVKAYNVVKFDVKLGENFKIELVDAPGLIRWFSDSDPVLHIITEDQGTNVTVKATDIGKSEIQLQFEGGLVKTLQVEVYDQIAVSLNPKSKSPILK